MTISQQNQERTTDEIKKTYTTEHTLRSGVKVIFRPIECKDQPKYRDFFKSLSPASIHYRYFEIVKELPNEAIERYCKLDYNQEIAIIAEPKSTDKIVAVVRLIVDRRNAKGEYALVVADQWQGLGLGQELMQYIIKIAHDYRLKEIHCSITSDNFRMINLAEKMGFKVKYEDEDTVEVSLELT